MRGRTVQEYAGQFEMHLTVSSGDSAVAGRFASWCRSRSLKCVDIVLARGQSSHQPMATWRKSSTTLSAVVSGAEALVREAGGAGFEVVRLKVEANPANTGVPVSDADTHDHDPRNYFEHHVKLRRACGASQDGLLAATAAHGAHLSRNAFKDDGICEERFVTMRSHAIGRAHSQERLERLLADLRRLDEDIVEYESEYCVYDTNLLLDAGWLDNDR
jgi:hypothetical protein